MESLFKIGYKKELFKSIQKWAKKIKQIILRLLKWQN